MGRAMVARLGLGLLLLALLLPTQVRSWRTLGLGVRALGGGGWGRPLGTGLRPPPRGAGPDSERESSRI